MSINDINFHEAECADQPDEFPCICDKIKDRREAEMADAQEAEATGN